MHSFIATSNLAPIEFNIILGGFALFLIGIHYLGEGLTDAAGSKISDYIEKYTSSLFMAILVGTAITAIMNSSTAVTVISISLVRAGMMSLKQAIGISVGANIGTTMTTFIMSFNIEEYGYYFVFIGVMLIMFVKRKVWNSIGYVLFGFGLLFVGMNMMSSKLLVIADYPWFQDFMFGLKDQPWLALGGSTLATVVINSSAAVIGITQQLFSTGDMDMIVASAFVFGSNVGTTLTAIVASVGGSVSTRRAGWFHALYNVIGALLGMLLIVPYSQMVIWLNAQLNGSPLFAVSLNHFMFNIISTILVIPFIPAFEKLLEIIIPGKDNIRSRERIEPLDESLITVFPEGAMQLAKKTTIQMADIVVESIETSRNYLHSRDAEDYDVVMQLEEMVNKLDTEITSYLLKIVKSGAYTPEIVESYTKNVEVVKNYERMSDLSTNLVELYNMTIESRERFSKEALDDLDTMYQLLIDMLNRSNKIFVSEDLSGYELLIQDEEYMDLIEDKYREKHFKRLAEGICDTRIASSVYVDILSTLERIGDHGVNVARNVNSSVKLHANNR